MILHENLMVTREEYIGKEEQCMERIMETAAKDLAKYILNYLEVDPEVETNGYYAIIHVKLNTDRL